MKSCTAYFYAKLLTVLYTEGYYFKFVEDFL